MCEMDYWTENDQAPAQPGPNSGASSESQTGDKAGGAFAVPSGLQWHGSERAWERLTQAVRRNCTFSVDICPNVPNTCLMCQTLREQKSLDHLALTFDEMYQRYYGPRERSYEGGQAFDETLTKPRERAEVVEEAKRVFKGEGQ